MSRYNTTEDEDEEMQKNCLFIEDGSIVRRTKNHEYYTYYVEGIIEGIRQEWITKGLFLFLELRDEQSDEQFTLGVRFNTGACRGLVLQLAGKKCLEAIREKSNIRIEAQDSNKDPLGYSTYTQVRVFVDGNKADWALTKLPPIEERQFGNRRIKDDSKRLAIISSLIENIKEQLEYY